MKLSEATRFSLWMLYGIIVGPLILLDIVFAWCMLIFGIWNPTVPLYLKLLIPVYFGIFFVGCYITARVCDRLVRG